MDIRSFWNPSSETNSSTPDDLNIYINMGFDRRLSERAFTLFGDNVQDATTWLLRQSSLGEFPKRFKNNHANFKYTFYKSKIRLEDEIFIITDYEEQYNIIQVSPTTIYYPMTWMSLSDPNIDWVEVKHDTKPVLKRVQYGWTRIIGAIQLNIKKCRFWDWPEFLVSTNQKNFGNLSVPGHFTGDFHNDNSGPPTDNEKLIYSLYRLTNKKDIQFRFTPDHPKILMSGWDQRRINVERGLHWSKFILICEVLKIPDVILDDLIMCRNKSSEMRNKILELNNINVSETVIQDLIKIWRKFRNPRETILKKHKKWESYCKPFLNFDNMIIVDNDEGIVKLDIVVNDLMFDNHYRNDVLGVFNSFHSARKVNFIHMRRLFEALYGKVQSNLSIRSWVLLEDWEKKFWERCNKKSKKYTNTVLKNKDIFLSEYDHQNAAISWLLDKENNSRSYGVVGWNKMEEPDGFTWWRSSWGFIKLTAASPDNIVGGYPCKGGLLCQCVGAGKSFELIKLIDIQKQTNATTKPTLIIAPTSMLTVWQEEINKFSDSISSVLYYGSRRKNIDLNSYDCIITSYRLIVNEKNSVVSPLFEADKWSRIICDECHYMRDIHSKTFKAVNGLTAPIKWCISATPFVKSFLELSSYLSFFGIHPFNERPRITLNSLLHMAETNPSLAEIFFNTIEQNVFVQSRKRIDTISKLKAPTIHYKDIIIKTPYNKLYEALFEGAKIRIKNSKNHSQIMQIIQRMRMASFHPCMINIKYYGNPLPIGKGGVPTTEVSFDSFEIADGGAYNDTLKKQLEDYKENGGNCCICMDTIDRPTMTSCGHMYCYECIHNAFSHQTTKQCPICRSNLENKLLYELKDNGRDMTEDINEAVVDKEHKKMFGEFEMELELETLPPPSCEEIKIPKVKWIFEKIKNGKKLVIFTQFNIVLEYLKCLLTIFDIPYGFINGSMSIKKRGKAIRDFQVKEKFKIFILTTKSANTGITLTAASSIVFMEPCINKKKHLQAIGRINRLGQMENSLNVYTLKTEDSVDEIINNKMGTITWLEENKLI